MPWSNSRFSEAKLMCSLRPQRIEQLPAGVFTVGVRRLAGGTTSLAEAVGQATDVDFDLEPPRFAEILKPADLG
jgi:hypothetical protein